MRLPVGAHVWPDNGRPELVRLAHHCSVRHDDPFAVEPHAIVAVLCVPIDVVDPEAISEGAAESVAACESVEPGFQWPRDMSMFAPVVDPRASKDWYKFQEQDAAHARAESQRVADYYEQQERERKEREERDRAAQRK